MANGLRGEVPFEPAGEGAVIRFTNHDLVELKGLYAQSVDIGGGVRRREWMQPLIDALDRYDAEAVNDCLRVGVKLNGARLDKKKFEALSADLPPNRDIAPSIIDGLYHAVYGKSFAEMQDEIAEMHKKLEEELAKAKANPPSSPESSSPASGQPPSEQASPPTSSGT